MLEQVVVKDYPVINGDKDFSPGKFSAKLLSVQINATDLDAADGSISIKGSNDGENFVDVIDPSTSTAVSMTLDAGDSQNAINLYDYPYSYIRIVFTKGANTVGTITILLNGK